MKKYLYIIIIGLLVVGSARLVRKMIFRYPTQQEMLDYCKEKMLGSTEGIKVEQLGDGKFAILNTAQKKGESAKLIIEAPKRWTMPWDAYSWKNKSGVSSGTKPKVIAE